MKAPILFLAFLAVAPPAPAATPATAPAPSAELPPALAARGAGTNGPGTLRAHSSRSLASTDAPATTNAVSGLCMETLDDKHRLAIGDKLSFRVVEEQREPKALLVTDSGDLEAPYIGRFPAVNKTCKELAHELKAALEKEFFYQATVILAVDSMTQSRGRVYLVGPVHLPGPQEIPSDEVLTLSKAILRAGGFTDFADKHNVKVTRKQDGGRSRNKTITVDVGRIFDKGKTELDLPLEPDDLILIPERVVRF